MKFKIRHSAELGVKIYWICRTDSEDVPDTDLGY